MRIYVEPARDQWPFLIRRVNRDDARINWRVSEILQVIKDGGDAALINVISEVEGAVPANLRVTSKEFDDAVDAVPQDLKDAILEAASRIRAFHELEIPRDITWNDGGGIVCSRRFLPLQRAGIYIPGGTAPLFSTVLMLGIPSGIAGCPERMICTPPSKEGTIEPAILYAARVCGIDEVYKVGGAQAIAAMAYGTGTIRKVSKIFGPGNRYVLKAKQLVCRDGIAIDMPAGPSEVMVVADSSANPCFIASDMLSQTEHGWDSQALLICEDYSFAQKVKSEINKQKANLPRREVIEHSLADSRIIVMKGLENQMQFANHYAPEHLILSVSDPEKAAKMVTAAGSVFLGNYSPESAGDYSSGTNHNLPTVGNATSWSGIGVESFMHAISYQNLTKAGLSRIGPGIIKMAEAEGLKAHADAVRYRIYEGNE